MEISGKAAFNSYKFTSVGLLLHFIVLVITAIIIQIFEAYEQDFYIHLFTVTHIFAGFTFIVLNVLHAKKHWKLMMNYIHAKGLIVSREAVYALLLTAITILIGFLFVVIFIS